jgi:hypothetical protein
LTAIGIAYQLDKDNRLDDVIVVGKNQLNGSGCSTVTPREALDPAIRN